MSPGPGMSHGIAIVGIACRYPDARNPGELWENVLAMRQAFRRIPPERLRLEDYHSADRSSADHTYGSEAALLEGWEFDRLRFKVVGSTFRSADLAHWLALEVAAGALADAGFPDGEGLPADTTGVVVGNSLTGEFSRANLMRLRWPYVRRVVAAELLAEGRGEEEVGRFLARLEATYKRPYPEMTEESLAGGLANTIAGRIANHFDLGGGGFTVDGACASSLLAVCQSCSALAAGDVDVGLAGGVDLSLDPFELVGFSRAGALAAGDMKVYDRRSQGFIPGEGCGFVVLMRRADALAQGRRIYATIYGWGISSDGSGGITRPEVDGQLLAFERAYRRAGFGPERVGLFEGHGTGTAVGDQTELSVLTEARRRASEELGEPLPRVAVGSIKANIGHTKAAAGVAALLKATLAVSERMLPPATGCEDPHPLVGAEGALLQVLDRPEPWPATLPAVAGVSAMGFGGINTHLVIEGEEGPARRASRSHAHAPGRTSQGVEVFLLAASDLGTLAARVDKVAARSAQLSRAELTDLAARLAREAGPERLRAAVVASSARELAERLALLAGWLEEGITARLDAKRGVFLGHGASGRAGGAPRVGFLFPGQGSPSYLDGGVWARRFPAVAERYHISKLPRTDDVVATAVAQPAIVTASLAALALLSEVGIEAEAAVGHSLGEVVALCWAGAFDEATALGIARVRGRAMSELGAATGAMAGIGAAAPQVESLLAGLEASIAGLNSPRQTVISGEATAIEAAIGRAKALGLEATRLKVSHAFHSPLVAAATPRLAEHLARIESAPLRATVASTVTGAVLEPKADLRALLSRQVTSPVRFLDAVSAVGERIDLWIEVGPGQVLSGLAADLGVAPAIALDAGSSSLVGLANAVAAAFVLGVPLSPTALFEDRFTRPFDLDREPRFLISPCELAPLPGVREAPSEPLEAPAAHAAAPVVAGSERSPVAVVRALVAARAELPESAIGEGSRLLSDLHLNSISVGQLVAEAARQLGLAAPASPTDFANATVAEVAGFLAEQLALGPAAAPREERVPLGVDSWVRPFTVELVEKALGAPRPAAAGTGEWRIFAPPEHPLSSLLAQALADLPGRGAVLCLPAEPDFEQVGRMLSAARAGIAAGRFVVVQQGGGGGGLARTLHREHREVTTLVVDLPFDDPRATSWVRAEIAAAGEYVEAHYDDQGTRREPQLAVAAELACCESGSGPLCSAADVLLVTGGGKGIGAECALTLARSTGVRLLLLGRSRPEDDAELAANLARMEAEGAQVLYLVADVADGPAVAAALAQGQAQLGPVTGVMHSAGRNVPKLLMSLTEEDFRATLAPKLDGLANVLAAIDPARLRRLVVFGSIIARIGMQGEADYATANEWLRMAAERFAAQHPQVQTLVLEWSVWAGVGMGERLGRIEALLREGVTPIPPDLGVELLSRYVNGPLPRSALVVSGRFGEVPTLKLPAQNLPFLRFLDRPRVFYPGVELVVDVEVSGDSDPYLADHVFRGERLFPAVMGLEAMGQLAMALTGKSELPVFENVQLTRPVVVPEGSRTTLRLAALAQAPDRVDVVLRTSANDFQGDCFRCVCRFGLPRPAGELARELPNGARALPLAPQQDLYGGVLFQQGRFRRLTGYRHLRATECRAEIGPDGATSWFNRYLPAELILGDPAARDAAIHGIQPCIPHTTILPTGVERIWAGHIPADQPCAIVARERYRKGNEFVYDLEILAASGELIERWEGLTLRAVQRLPEPAAWRASLLGPYVERRLQELLLGPAPRVWVETDPAEGPGRSDRAVAHLLAEDHVRLARRPDGKPELVGRNGPRPRVSVSHAGELVVAVSGPGAVGCDVEPIEARSAEVWADLLGIERTRLAEVIAAERREVRDVAASRVWAAGECLKKAAAHHDAPLVLEAPRVDEAQDGWVVLRSGAFSVATFVGPVAELGGRVALAVAVKGA
ncbi:MAG TPA: SDR family NAD(P)-dependent oxidoreductase [Thermoanaerobaculia bacterium]|nr:SDR family NAD(P)-dependent oxidoreductase [Thermoanaerobaculia bacterium]